MSPTSHPPYPGMPLWVKIFGGVAVVAAVLFVIAHLTHGGIAHLSDHNIGESSHADPGAHRH